MGQIDIGARDRELDRRIQQGDLLGAFEEFCADDIAMRDGNAEATVGKAANRRREEEFVGSGEQVQSVNTSLAAPVCVDLQLAAEVQPSNRRGAMRRPPLAALLTPAASALAVCTLGPSAAAQQPEHTIDLSPPFEAEMVADLEEPWAMTFLPGGRMLVTEKRGSLHVVTQHGQVSEAIAGVPEVYYDTNGGLGDVVLHPDFADNRLVYLTWAEAGEGDTRGAAMGRGKLDLNAMRLDNFEVLWRQTPKVAEDRHYSYRMAFAPDGQHLFLTSGDRWIPETAQDTSNNLGAVLRLTLDGKAAPGNPMYDTGGATAEIWSYGHRSLVGLAFDAEGTLWETEMGPTGGDEFQKIEKGKNYGWPLVSYGDHYGGPDIPGHDTRPDLRAPETYWNPVISPSSMIIYSGALFPDWQGSALITGLTSQALIRVSFECPLAFRDICELERFHIGNRLREIEQGPDGAIWLLEDGDKEEAGRLLKLTPR